MARNTTQAFEALKEYLVQNHNAKTASGGREIIKRCHICGDSRDPTDAHMYIGINKNGIIVYNCFKCNAGGSVDGKFLRDMDCYEPGIIEMVNQQNSANSDSGKSYSSKSFQSRFPPKPMRIPYCTNEYALKKFEYIKKRLGINFLDQTPLVNLKIILNLKEFLTANGITKYTRHPDLMDLLDKYFIGFLSADNSYVILRRLIPEGKLPEYIDSRYVVYNIYGNNSGVKYYFLPTLVNPKIPVDIHIAEGCFDIISIYDQLEMHAMSNHHNSIYAAVCGKAYGALVKFMITTFGLMYFNLHIYPDNDVTDNELKKMVSDLSIFSMDIYVHRNTYPGEKDFGVDKSHIQEEVYMIRTT